MERLRALWNCLSGWFIVWLNFQSIPEFWQTLMSFTCDAIYLGFKGVRHSQQGIIRGFGSNSSWEVIYPEFILKTPSKLKNFSVRSDISLIPSDYALAIEGILLKRVLTIVSGVRSRSLNHEFLQMWLEILKI